MVAIYSCLNQAQEVMEDVSTTGMKDLPVELKEKILFSFSLRTRLRVRLASKEMRDAVDTSMSDVKEIVVEEEEGKCNANIKTVNPYNGAVAYHRYPIALSSLPFLLEWAGVRLKKLSVMSSVWRPMDDASLTVAGRMFEALNNDNACPKLMNLAVTTSELVCNNEIIFGEFLKFLTKRQLQATAADNPVPFLRSLSMIEPPFVIRETWPIRPLNGENTRKLLQEVLDQCHGLKELNIDRLLMVKSLPVTSLRYPTTLTHLISKRLGESLNELSMIVSNCPKLQILRLNIEFAGADAAIDVLESLSDLRELSIVINSRKNDEIVRLIEKSMTVLGADAGHPWPQLKSFSLSWYTGSNCGMDSLVLRGANSRITSLSLSRPFCHNDDFYVQPVEQVFKALMIGDAFLNLMELSIASCDVFFTIMNSLETPTRRSQCRSYNLPSAWARDSRLPSAFFRGVINDLLAYLTKRQSAVQCERPFLRSLSLIGPPSYCNTCHDRLGHQYIDICNKIEEIRKLVQQVLDQCHGLEVLNMDSLNDETVNPDQKKGKQLADFVALIFPTTLKKLNGVRIDNNPHRLQTIG